MFCPLLSLQICKKYQINLRGQTQWTCKCVSVCQNADVLWEPTTRVHSCFPAAGAQQQHWSTLTKPNYWRYVLKSLSISRKSLHKLCFFVLAKVGFGVAFLYLFFLFFLIYQSAFFSLIPKCLRLTHGRRFALLMKLNKCHSLVIHWIKCAPCQHSIKCARWSPLKQGNK